MTTSEDECPQKCTHSRTGPSECCWLGGRISKRWGLVKGRQVTAKLISEWILKYQSLSSTPSSRYHNMNRLLWHTWSHMVTTRPTGYKLESLTKISLSSCYVDFSQVLIMLAQSLIFLDRQTDTQKADLSRGVTVGMGCSEMKQTNRTR